MAKQKTVEQTAADVMTANRFGAYDPVCATKQRTAAPANTDLDQALKQVHDKHVARLVDELQDASARQKFIENYFAEVDALVEEVIHLKKQLQLKAT
jgi:hypothetical protein